MSLSTIGSIANHITEIYTNISEGISGNMIEIVDMARQNVENYVGDDIGSNSIAEKYQPPIVNFAKAEVIDLENTEDDAGDVKLAELSVSNSGEEMSAKQLRMLAESQLKNIGRKVRFARSLS